MKKEYDVAEDLFREVMHAAQQHNDADGIALSHYYLGRYMRDLEHWEKAKQHLEATVEWCESHLDQSDLDITILMGAKGNLGFTMFHLGDYTGGRKLVQQSVNFFDQMNLQRYATSFRWRLTLIEHALGNRESALQYAQETMFWAAPERLHMEREFTETRTLLQELQDKERAPTSTEKGETEETASSPSYGMQEGTHHHG